MERKERMNFMVLDWYWRYKHEVIVFDKDRWGVGKGEVCGYVHIYVCIHTSISWLYPLRQPSRNYASVAINRPSIQNKGSGTLSD